MQNVECRMQAEGDSLYYSSFHTVIPGYDPSFAKATEGHSGDPELIVLECGRQRVESKVVDRMQNATVCKYDLFHTGVLKLCEGS